MKKNIGSILLIIVLLFVAVALKSVADVMKQGRAQSATATSTPVAEVPVVSEAPTESTGKISGSPADFAHEGIIHFTSLTSPISTTTLSYLEGNVRPATTTLSFDELSACAGSNGSQPCIEFNIPLGTVYNNKDVVVEGTRLGDTVVVRKLMVQEPGDHSHIPPVGRTFISWPQAVNFINSCGPKMILQTHDLDVNLRFDDGTTLVAVEPVIDEVMRVAESARAQCGAVPIATE
ncbi:MAG: hypothetical protein V4481_00685 [Patescibacteria group bacterium]